MAYQGINIGALPNDNTGDPLRTAFDKSNLNDQELYTQFLDNIIVVKTASQLSGTLDGTKVYYIDGVIDMTGVSVEVPLGGLTIDGYGFDVSKLLNTELSYTMFTSPVGGSGNIFINNCSIEVSGSGSKVFELTDATGLNAAEFDRVNWDSCTDLGYLDGYRQGLETGTGRFGGTPSLEFRGTWLGGYFIQTSIVRQTTNAAFTMFSSAVGHTFASRFGGNPNILVEASSTIFDFREDSFTADDLFQLDGANFQGAGTVLAVGAGKITPQSTQARIANSKGVENTYVGANWAITAEVLTVLAAATPDKLAGTTTESDLTWFSAPGDNDLTYDSTEVIRVRPEFVGAFTAGNNQVFDLILRKWDNSAASYTDIATVGFTTNGAGRAESVTLISPLVEIDENDRIEVWVESAGGNNITGLLNSRLIIEEARS